MGARDGTTVVVVVIDDVEIPVRTRADLQLVDALARLALVAKRNGSSMVLRDPCERLVELLELVALPLRLE